jgi:hypothetical protein
LPDDRNILERQKTDKIFYIGRYRERRRKKEAKKGKK